MKRKCPALLRWLGAFVTAPLLSPGSAAAHQGHLHWWEIETTWSWDPLVIAPLLLTGVFYARGGWRLWTRAHEARRTYALMFASFAAGWFFLAAALVSPLHWLGERLFTAHMAEHELLMIVAAPLLLIGRPVGPFMWALPRAIRKRLANALARLTRANAWTALIRPGPASALHALVIWGWHAPLLYELALSNARVHWLQHVSFLLSALLFWWSLLRNREHGYGSAVLFLLLTAMHTGLLGVLLAMARAPVYPAQTATSADWGLSPVEDQQLAGILMWVPGGLVYAIAALVMAGLWIARSAPSSSGGAYVVPQR
jgi:putative membrane protein